MYQVTVCYKTIFFHKPLERHQNSVLSRCFKVLSEKNRKSFSFLITLRNPISE